MRHGYGEISFVCARMAPMFTGQPQKVKPRKLSDAELADLSRLGSPLLTTLAMLANKRLTCAHCKRCSRRCEVLEGPDLDVGLVEMDYQRITNLAPEYQPEAVRELVAEQPELYYALRRCCFCGFCTSTCQTHMTAPDRMREWRELFRDAGLMPVDDKLVMVDEQWHIFSAYRAIYGVAYPEFKQLSDLAESGQRTADCLLFPGCTLVSYVPDLIRSIGGWMDEAGLAWAMTDDCCGSPLMSQGLFERATALREKTLRQIRAVGIKKVFTICPGCGEELAEIFGDEVEIIPLPEILYQQLQERSVLMGEAEDTGLEPGEVSEANDSHKERGSINLTDIESLTFFDSCHDRFDNRHGIAIRKLLAALHPASEQIEMEHHGKETLCCGAGGAVSTFDPELTRKRTRRVITEARESGARSLVTACPTCTYTISGECLSSNRTDDIRCRHYLELVYGQDIDWEKIFAQLEAMWTGEYGPWLAHTFS